MLADLTLVRVRDHTQDAEYIQHYYGTAQPRSGAPSPVELGGQYTPEEIERMKKLERKYRKEKEKREARAQRPRQPTPPSNNDDICTIQ